ncbi:hypothetical protein [Saccharothrix luteola]|uniref:hypothetical protein n=1 Tax=Saccharothrix luteola TaxID=2893018 RepID=UPI001E370D2B|nr:hypothetical protein [Saccharothrix luteola]MCC8246314.1 hypothetical protein [Saccharothrix luteola]
MTVPEPVQNLDDLLGGMIGVVPAVGPEELTQGHGLTELGAFGDEWGDEWDRGGRWEAVG